MRLYLVYGSPSCRKVQAVVSYLDLDVEEVALSFTAGDLATPDFLALNPNGLVPALEDDGFVLWESNAIMQYLATKQGASPLFPTDPKARADITRWQYWEQAHFNRAMGTLVFEKSIKPTFGLGEPDAALVEAATHNFHRYAPVLEAQLQRQAFVADDGVTLADFSVGAMLGFAEPAEVPLQDYPAINTWRRRLEAIPAWADSAPPWQ